MGLEAPNSAHALLPTRKWWVAQVTALTGIAIMAITTNSWDQEESIAAITWFAGAFSTWLIPNDPTNTNSGLPPAR